MPITFEQPIPLVGFDIAQGYGQLQQQMKNRDYQLQADQAQARENDAAANRYQQSLEFEQQQQNAADAQQRQQEFAQQQEQLQEQLNQAKLTQLDHLRAAQQVNQLAILRADPVLSQPEHADELSGYVNELTTGINTYQRRVQVEAAQQQQQEHEQRTQLVMEQLAEQHTRNQYFAQNAQDHIGTITDPITGEQTSVFFDQHGQPHPWNGGAGAGSTRGSGGAGARDGDLNATQYLSHYNDAVKEVDSQFQHTQSYGTIFDPQANANRAMTRSEAIQQALQDRGMAPDVQTHMQRQQEARNRPRPQPIPEGTPPGRLTEVQSTTLQGLQAIQQQIPPSPDGQPSDDALRLQSLIQLYRQYGNVRAMPPQQRVSFENTLRIMAQKYGASNAASNAGDAVSGGGGGGDY